MKKAKSYLLVCLFLACSLHAAAQLSAAERAERCQNNKLRLAELEKQSEALSSQLAKIWSQEEINRAVDDMTYIRKQKVNLQSKITNKDNNTADFEDQEDNVIRLGRKFGFDMDDCMEMQEDVGYVRAWLSCLKKLETVMGKKIDAAKLTVGKYKPLRQQKASIDKQIANHRTNIIALNCDGQAPAGTKGSLHLVGPEILGKSRKESYNAVIYTEYEYSANTAKLTQQNDPPDKKVFSWEFRDIPTQLSPGDEFTITIKGTLEIHVPGEITPASAGVRVKGLEAIQQENAFLGVSQKRDGTFKYRVPLDATSCTIEIGADMGLGTFARYRYEK